MSYVLGLRSRLFRERGGPFLPLPAPGLPPTSPGRPSPTAVVEASNTTSCEDPAQGAPPIHCLGL